jgi:hypothetical protein
MAPRFLVAPALFLGAALALPGCDRGGDSGEGSELDLRRPTDVIAADLDGDGRIDVAFSISSDAGVGFVDVLLNTSSGGATATFAAESRFTLAPYAGRLIAGDVDGDGMLDFVSSHAFPDQLTIGLNDPLNPGEFLFGGPIALPTLPSSFASGDVSSDGRTDVVLAFDTSQPPSVLYKDAVSPAGFGPLTPVRNGEPAHLVRTGDFDGDGRGDVVTGFFDGTNFGVRVFLQDGTAPGSFKTPSTRLTTIFPEHLEVGDWNDDGRLDVAITSTADVAELLFQDPLNPGQLLAPADYPVGASAGSEQIALEGGDMDGDGLLDLVVASNHTIVLDPDAVPPVFQLDTVVSVLLQDPSLPGTFLAPSTFDVDEDTSDLALADFDGDGLLDVVTIGHNPNVMSFHVLHQDPATPGDLLPAVPYPLQ